MAAPHGTPPKKPTKLQQKAALDVVQRAVGFEFQTNWGIVEKVSKKGAFGRTKSEYRPFNKGETLHHYQGYKLTADEAGTELGAEIEWVVDPPLPDSLPINQVDQLMQSLENLVAQFVALQNQDRFMLDSITGDPRDATIEVRPKIKSAANAQNMKANPQVTGGIRLDQMQTLFKQLGQPNTADPQHQHVLALLTGMGGAGMMGASGAAADAVGGSDKLKGLATQLIAYLKAGSDPLIQTMGFSAGRAFDYAKLIGKLMARTDFASQFKMLDPQERQPFEQNPQTFVDLILNAAGMTGTDNTLVFERAIKNQAGDPSKGVFNFPVTRKDWLWMIVQGTDQLSSKAMPQWKDELEGLGALGGKTDSLASGERGVVAEFRTVQQQMPYTQWRQFAIDVLPTSRSSTALRQRKMSARPCSASCHNHTKGMRGAVSAEAHHPTTRTRRAPANRRRPPSLPASGRWQGHWRAQTRRSRTSARARPASPPRLRLHAAIPAGAARCAGSRPAAPASSPPCRV